VVRLPAYARQQVFLSGNSAIHGKWGVAGGNDGEEDATAAMKRFP
jgi:hypothetical protein